MIDPKYDLAIAKAARISDAHNSARILKLLEELADIDRFLVDAQAKNDTWLVSKLAKDRDDQLDRIIIASDGVRLGRVVSWTLLIALAIVGTILAALLF